MVISLGMCELQPAGWRAAFAGVVIVRLGWVALMRTRLTVPKDCLLGGSGAFVLHKQLVGSDSALQWLVLSRGRCNVNDF